MLSTIKVVDRYLEERVVSSLYEKNLRRIARGCPSLTSQVVNAYLRARLKAVASVTVAYERAILCGLWSWAYDTGIFDAPPRGIVKIKPVRQPTRAWTLDQCYTLVKGTFAYDVVRLRTGANLGKLLRCWILLGYETGARQGDLWAMKSSDFVDNTLWWSQSKTAEPVPKVLSPACMKSVREMLADSPDGSVLGWSMLKSSGRRRMRAYLDGFKLSGSSKWLRRSSCTHVEINEPGKGKTHLGHKTAGMAERFYIDWTQVKREIPQTPRLLE